MPLSKRAQIRYRQALGAFGAYPVQLELDVGTLALLIGALQQTLRQPAGLEGLAGWLDGVITALGTLSADLATGLRAGEEP